MIAAHQKRALKKALKLPGMESHIRRLKASWRLRRPSDDVLYTWVRHKVARELLSEMLMKLSLSEMLAMRGAGATALASYAVETSPHERD